MSKFGSRGTTEWVAGNLRKEEHVSNVDLLSDQVLCVSRQKYAPFLAGVVSASRVEANTIVGIIDSEHDVEIIVNVPKESFWTGSALSMVQDHDIAMGGYGDLFRVVHYEDVRTFVQKEVEFVERGLRQHNCISNFERLHDRIYRIQRTFNKPDIVVAMLNEYELTADHLRCARDRYGEFSVVAITNPNGSATSSAYGVAESLQIEILGWSAFFGRLNKR